MLRRDSEWAAAVVAVQETGAWVRHTDTKAGVLAAGLGVIAAAVITQAADIADAFTSTCWSGPTLTVLLAALIAASVIVLRLVALTIRPHVVTANRSNRFAWPSLAGMATATRSSEYASCADEAWAQAIELAAIAEAKYLAFSKAAGWFCVFLALAVFLVIAAYVL